MLLSSVVLKTLPSSGHLGYMALTSIMLLLSATSHEPLEQVLNCTYVNWECAPETHLFFVFSPVEDLTSAQLPCVVNKLL